MSQFVVMSFFDGNVFTAPFSLRALGTQTSLYQSVVRTYLSFSINASHHVLFLDSPEQGPGAVLGFSGATASASGTGSSATSSLFGESSSTVDPTSSSSTTSSPTPKSSSSRGFIIDGVVGGVAAIFFAGVAIGFILRRRRQKTSGDDASEPSMDEIQWPLATDDGHMASSTGNFGTMGSSSIPETPVVLVTTYVRVSCPICRRALMCAPHDRSLTHSLFSTHRTRMIHLRSLGTKVFCKHWPHLLIETYRRSMELETP